MVKESPGNFDPESHPSQSDLVEFEGGASSFRGKTTDEILLLERAGKARMVLRNQGDNVQPEIHEQYRDVMDELNDLIKTLQNPETDRSLRVNMDEE